MNTWQRVGTWAVALVAVAVVACPAKGAAGSRANAATASTPNIKAVVQAAVYATFTAAAVTSSSKATIVLSPPTLTPTPPAAPRPTPTSVATTPTPTLGTMLIVIQTGLPVSPGDPLATQFQGQLDTLAPRCSDTEARLSDFTVATRDVMLKRGVAESYLSILSHVNASIPAGLDPQPCAPIFAAYATLRIGG